MGLDQYLYAKKYIGGWEHSKTGEQEDYRRIMGIVTPNHAKPFRCESSPHLEVEVCVAYWRKANQIHSWFVTNVQSGEDDCGTFYVDPSQLKALRDLCQQVLDKSPTVPGKVKNVLGIEEGEVMTQTAVAEELLPVASGFFFGSQEYDQWYIDDLKRTVEQIDKALELFGQGWEFYYRSSW